MGIFSVDVAIAKPRGRPPCRDAGRVMVDTGFQATWIEDDALRRAGIVARKKDQPVLMANGQQIRRDIGYAIIRAGDLETIDEVVFARPGDLQLLGARTIEGFNAIVDAKRKRLVAAGPMPAAAIECRATPGMPGDMWDARTWFTQLWPGRRRAARSARGTASN